MKSKINISKEIKQTILSYECNYDYVYTLLEENTKEAMSGILNSYLYLLRNINNDFNREVLDNLFNLLNNFVKKNKDKQLLEVIYNKIQIFIENLTKSFNKEKIFHIEKYISNLIDIQYKCLSNNTKRAKGEKYNFILYLIFEKRDIRLLSKYIEDNMKSLLISNSILPSVFMNIIEKYVQIDEDNITEISYYNQVINLFLRGKIYDKLLKDKTNDYIRILISSDKWFTHELLDKLENDLYQDRESISKYYGISFHFPKDLEKYENRNAGVANFNSQNILTIDGEDDVCLDDGLYATKNADGTSTLYIHLANPPSLIPYRSNAMYEALKRQETIYLPDQNINIFEPYLSEDILSFLPGKRVNALTYIVEVDTDYSLMLDTLRLVPSSIINRNKLSYEKVDDILSHNSDKILYETLALLYNIFQKHAKDNPQVTAYHKLDNLAKKKQYTNSANSDISSSHLIVEHSMVMANSFPYILDQNENLELVLPWRIQPHSEEVESLLNEFLSSNNKFDVNSKSFQEFIKSDILRSKYSIQNKGHSGLGLPGYVRMSSALRRSMDNLAIYPIYDLYINRGSFEEMEAKRYFWEKEIKYWCDYANNRGSENINFMEEYNYLYFKGKILERKK